MYSCARFLVNFCPQICILQQRMDAALLFSEIWDLEAKLGIPVALKFLTQTLIDWVEVSWDKAA